MIIAYSQFSLERIIIFSRFDTLKVQTSQITIIPKKEREGRMVENSSMRKCPSSKKFVFKFKDLTKRCETICQYLRDYNRQCNCSIANYKRRKTIRVVNVSGSKHCGRPRWISVDVSYRNAPLFLPRV